MKFNRHIPQDKEVRKWTTAYHIPYKAPYNSLLRHKGYLVTINEISNNLFRLQCTPLPIPMPWNPNGEIISEHDSLATAIVAYRILQSQGSIES